MLTLIRESGLKLNLEKSAFGEYRLGHEITGAGLINLWRRKIRTDIEFPVPTVVHEVRQFVGLTSYFRSFVKFFLEYVIELGRQTADSFWTN